MDFSKLPKLSQTPAPPGAGPMDPSPAPTESAGAPPTGAPAAVELFCRCGAPITPGTNFCSHCGANYYEAVGGRRRDGARSGGDDLTGGQMWIEAFLSIAIGVVLLMIAPGGTKLLSAKLAGRPYLPYLHPTDAGVWVDYIRYIDPNTGAVLADYKYRDLFDQYWSDIVVTAFAFTLILEGFVIALVRNKWVNLVCGLLIVAVTVLNLWYVMASFTRISPITKAPYGLPMISVLAVIFGVVMAGYQFLTYSELRRRG